jgi:hypothetical protein
MVNTCKSGGMCTAGHTGGKKHGSKKHSRSNKPMKRHGTKKRTGSKKGKGKTRKHRGGMGLAAAKTAAVPFGLLGLQKWFQNSRSRK